MSVCCNSGGQTAVPVSALAVMVCAIVLTSGVVGEGVGVGGCPCATALAVRRGAATPWSAFQICNLLLLCICQRVGVRFQMNPLICNSASEPMG